MTRKATVELSLFELEELIKHIEARSHTYSQGTEYSRQIWTLGAKLQVEKLKLELEAAG